MHFNNEEERKAYWSNPNTIYTWTGVMTTADEAERIVTTSAWTLGFWNELSNEFNADFDETFVYQHAKERGALLYDIKTVVDDTTPFTGGPILLHENVARQLEENWDNSPHDIDIERVLHDNIVETYQARIDTSFQEGNEEAFQQAILQMQTFLQGIGTTPTTSYDA